MCTPSTPEVIADAPFAGNPGTLRIPGPDVRHGISMGFNAHAAHSRPGNDHGN